MRLRAGVAFACCVRRASLVRPHRFVAAVDACDTKEEGQQRKADMYAYKLFVGSTENAQDCRDLRSVIVSQLSLESLV